MGQEQSSTAPPPPSNSHQTKRAQDFSPETVLRIIVVGASGSGKSTFIGALKPLLSTFDNAKVYYEVSESNDGVQTVIDAYGANAPSNMFTAMIFIADLANDGSLMALSEISKRFRDHIKAPNLLLLVANKIDIPDASRGLKLSKMVELADNDTFFKGVEILKCSAVTGVGVEEIAQRIKFLTILSNPTDVPQIEVAQLQRSETVQVDNMLLADK